jgi:hypothetical protein
MWRDMVQHNTARPCYILASGSSLGYPLPSLVQKNELTFDDIIILEKNNLFLKLKRIKGT